MDALFERLRVAAERFPDRCAIRQGQQAVSYREYYRSSSVIAHRLSRMEPDLRKPILVLITDTVTDLFAFMGILAIGGFYVPLSSNTSANRIQDVMQNYDFAAVLTTGEPKLEIERCLNVRDILDDPASSESAGYVGEPLLPTTPAFGLFTSGSTGIPKLVLKSHQSILRMCQAFNEEFGFDENDVFGNQVSFEFDSSCKSVFLALYNHATVCLISPKDFMFPRKVIDAINEYRANVLIWSTFALRILANFKAFDYASIPSVKTVMVSGESIPENAIAYWMEHVDAAYYNLYAPTEYSFNCLAHRIARDEIAQIPLGTEIRGSKVYVIADGRLCAEGEEGELYIAGPGLALGYFRDADKTARHFVQNPLHNDYPDIVYRTGDYGVKQGGLFYFRGRVDHQIKHQGYRIELGEIESAANGIAGVHISAALFDAEKQLILLYFEGDVSQDELYQQLKSKLPGHLLPKRVVRLERIPLNQNNKVDRQALKNRS
ncbi:MAG: AMP-binding protein [Bacillota bacterium]|nr:AMP-binding protein [Bacillota bacterium]